MASYANSQSTSFVSSAGATLNEFFVPVEIYLSKSAVATRKPQLPRRSVKPEKRDSLRTSPSISELNYRKVKAEKSSWLSLSRGSSGSDQWRSAMCKLVEEEEGTVLKIYLEETTLYQSVYIHLLHHTDIRQIHRSLFDRKDCLGIFCSSDNLWNLTIPIEPLYFQFADTEIMNIWLALLRSYASPEVYGRWQYASEGGLYRMWRQVDMTLIQGRSFRSTKLAEDIVFGEFDSRQDSEHFDMDIYCEIFINSLLCGRSTVKNGSRSPDWHEQFCFTDLPPFANMEIVVLRDKKMARPVMIGSAVVALMNFRRGEQIEAWLPVLGGQLHAGMIVGELRLRLRVDEEIILPRSLYMDMLRPLQSTNCLDWITELEAKLQVRGISEHITAVANAHGTLARDLMELVDREVDGTPQSHTTLFRGNTNFSRTMEAYMVSHGAAFLEASVGCVIRRFCAEKVAIDSDALRGVKTKSVEKNVELLVHWCQELWRSIYDARGYCPSEMRQIFAHIRSLIVTRYQVTKDHHSELPWQGVSAFLFLRFLVPAILNPHLFGLWPGLTDETVMSSLKQVAKVIQSLANLNISVQKDDHLRALKDFLTSNHKVMIEYLDSLSSESYQAAIPVPSPLSPSDRSERKRVIALLKQRIKGAPTLNRESILLPPQMIDLAKHLAVVTSVVVRNTRKQLPTRTGAASELVVNDFCQKCLAVEEQALYRVSQLASRMRHGPVPPVGPTFLKTPPESPISVIEPQTRERKISLPSMRRPKKKNLRPSTAPGGGMNSSRSPSSEAHSSTKQPRRYSEDESRRSEANNVLRSPEDIVAIPGISEAHVAQLSLMHHPRSTSTDSALLRKTSAPTPPSSFHLPLDMFSANDFSEDPGRRRKGLRGLLRI